LGDGALFNLIIGFTEGQASPDRVLEWTDDRVKEWVSPSGIPDYSRLRNLPTLVMPELQDKQSQQVARVGYVEDISMSGRTLRFRFVPHLAFPAFDTAIVEQLALRLQVGEWEFNRHHWAVKDVDLYRVLHESMQSRLKVPTAFRLPTELSTEQDMVAVMMPFSGEFGAVYDALRDAATAAGMRCFRADDIWVNTHIIDDVINLIWRARAIISDLSGKNPNVFYETGIAHALGREVIQITQAIDDVPFDLRSIRTLPYLNNREGREELRDRVRKRLSDIIAAP
jgi:hypothetical protein